jgi:uncharacterized membrane protein YagU involved in acid resistance
MSPGTSETTSIDPADLARGLAAGLLGGLAGTLAMTGVQALWSAASGALAPRGGRGHRGGRRESKPATARVAQAIAGAATGRRLSRRAESIAANGVHYGFGTLMGGLYGALADAVPAVTLGRGAAFGAALMLGGDEGGVPALGLSEPPSEIPASTHAYALVSHLIYGLTAEAVRSAVRSRL